MREAKPGDKVRIISGDAFLNRTATIVEPMPGWPLDPPTILGCYTLALLVDGYDYDRPPEEGGYHVLNDIKIEFLDSASDNSFIVPGGTTRIAKAFDFKVDQNDVKRPTDFIPDGAKVKVRNWSTQADEIGHVEVKRYDKVGVKFYGQKELVFYDYRFVELVKDEEEKEEAIPPEEATPSSEGDVQAAI